MAFSAAELAAVLGSDTVAPVVSRLNRYRGATEYAMEAKATLVAERRWSKVRIARVDRRATGQRHGSALGRHYPAKDQATDRIDLIGWAIQITAAITPPPPPPPPPPLLFFSVLHQPHAKQLPSLLFSPSLEPSAQSSKTERPRWREAAVNRHPASAPGQCAGKLFRWDIT